MILTHSVRAATSLANQGDFHSAVEALGDLWPGIGVEPARNGETDVEHAQVLLACGILTVELGKFSPVPTHACGKDLLSKAARLFGDDPEKYTALFWLGTAYLLCGENREALSLCDSILAEQSADSDVVFRTGRTKALAHLNLGNFAEAEQTLSSIEIFLETAAPLSRGKFYLNRGMLFRQTDRLDQALVDYELANRSFCQAGSVRFQAAAQNNIAGVFTEQSRFREAHASARRALLCFRQIRDRAHEAKVLDQIAQICHRQENYAEMERHAALAVEILSAGDHDGWLAEALITLGTARARLGMIQAQEALSQALAICERQGDPKQAQAVTNAMWEIVRRGKETQDVMRKTISPIEGAVYERVLEAHRGHVSPAAHQLGLHHHIFQKHLKNRFPELLEKRLPPRKRHKSVVKFP